MLIYLVGSYDTIVNKSTLSGGQKQRLSIARALYRQPSVILLDEYTSSLDRVNRDAVVDTITKILQDKTAIVVSHSLETLRNVDASLVCIRVLINIAYSCSLLSRRR